MFSADAPCSTAEAAAGFSDAATDATQGDPALDAGIGSAADSSFDGPAGAAPDALADTSSGATPAYHPCPPAGTPCRIMPLSASITYGTSLLLVAAQLPPTQDDAENTRTVAFNAALDRKSTRLNSSHYGRSRMPSSA